MSGTIRVSVVATGIDASTHPRTVQLPLPKSTPEPELAFELNVQEIERDPVESFMIESSVDIQSEETENPSPEVKYTIQEESLVARQAVQKPEEKQSLWQRLRFGTSKPVETPRAPFEQPVTVRETSLHEENGEENPQRDEDDLGIPAFLRRNNKGQ
jgi:hypothetical protein